MSGTRPFRTAPMKDGIRYDAKGEPLTEPVSPDGGEAMSADPPVRAMLDGSPCWCYAPGIEPHEGWVHGSMCKGRRARTALADADGSWHAADCRPGQRFFGVTCLHCGSMSSSEDPRHE